MNHIVTYLKSFFMRGKCSDEKLLDKTDLIYLSALVLVFTVLAFFRLGDAHAPESSYTADAGNRDIVLDFGDYTDIGSFSVFLGNLNTRRFSISAFNEMTGSIDFLGVHPQYRKKGIARAFCEKALHELVRSKEITVTTFREGDKADTGYRQAFKKLGFAEAELLVEFGYPTQRFILQKSKAGFCSQVLQEPLREPCNHVLRKEETEGIKHE